MFNRSWRMGTWALVIPVSFLVSARTAPDSADEVKQVALGINQAFVRNDVDAIEPHVAGDITWFSHTATERLDGKQVFIDSLRKTVKTKQTFKWQERDLRVQVLGDAAIVSFFYDHSAEIGGRKTDRLSRATYVFAKRGGQWLLVHDHSSVPLQAN